MYLERHLKIVDCDATPSAYVCSVAMVERLQIGAWVK